MDKFQTAISHIAALLNCRTIAGVKVENAVQTLTPNHFLIGKLGGAVLTDKPDNPVGKFTSWQTSFGSSFYQITSHCFLNEANCKPNKPTWKQEKLSYNLIQMLQRGDGNQPSQKRSILHQTEKYAIVKYEQRQVLTNDQLQNQSHQSLKCLTNNVSSYT